MRLKFLNWFLKINKSSQCCGRRTPLPFRRVLLLRHPSYGFWLFVRRVCCAGGGGGGGAAAAASDSGAAFSLKKLVQLSSFFRVKLYRQLQDFTVLILVVCAGCIT